MAIQSKKEAFKLFAATKSKLLGQARKVAFELISKRGSTHTREVREVLIKRGIFTPAPGQDERWLGAIFNVKDVFRPTGYTVNVVDKERNIHEGRPTKIWTLAKHILTA